MAKVVGVCVAGKLTNIQHNTGEDADLLQTAGLTYIVPAKAVKLLVDAYLADDSHE